jgi:hypothetical protein
MPRAGAVCAVAALLVGAVATPARAAFPGVNGEIGFMDGSNQLSTVQPDGTSLTPLALVGTSPAYSADGRRIAFVLLPQPTDLAVATRSHWAYPSSLPRP